jgi:hypothetical protein
VIHYHGTPITPRVVLDELSGRHFCVSFAAPDQAKVCHQIGQSVMLDNGAFSVWRRGATIDWNAWSDWASEWLAYPTTWCVLPDSIDGEEVVNDHLLGKWAGVERGAPVWHLHESLERLQRLCVSYERVCFGSSGVYATIGDVAWRRRVSDAFDLISSPAGRVPWIHMLRGMSLSGDEFPFASVDSTDIARNHNRPQNTARAMVERWDSLQCPATWTRVEQMSLEKALA